MSDVRAAAARLPGGLTKTWAIYQEYVRATVQQQWSSRRRLLRWRAFVQQTHKDRYTLSTLDTWLRLNRVEGRFEAWEHVEAELAARC